MREADRVTREGPGGPMPAASGSLRSPASKKDLRPTPDQIYLAEKLNGATDVGGAGLPQSVEGLTMPIGPGPEKRRVQDAAGSSPAPGSSHLITPAAVQRWNIMYGVAAVSDAMRAAWGFPPLAGIDNPYAYVDGILRSDR